MPGYVLMLNHPPVPIRHFIGYELRYNPELQPLRELGPRNEDQLIEEGKAAIVSYNEDEADDQEPTVYVEAGEGPILDAVRLMVLQLMTQYPEVSRVDWSSPEGRVNQELSVQDFIKGH